MIVLHWHRRLRYAQRVGDALKRCTGLEGHPILIYLDGGYDLDLVKYADNIDLPNKTVICSKQSRPTGINNAVLAALDIAFEENEYVVALEEDMIPAPDMLEYFNWARDKYRENKRVFSVCAYCRDVFNPRWLHRVARRRWFHSWGWATWLDRWKDIRPKLIIADPKNRTYDQQIAQILLADGRYEVYPKLARVQNIGAVGGVNIATPEWHLLHDYNIHWSGDHVIPKGEWEEVE